MMQISLFILSSRILKTVVATVGLAALLFWSSDYIANRSSITVIYDEFYRVAEETPVDVLVMGSSHSQTNVNTLMLAERLEFNVYTLGVPAQTLGLTRYALEDALRVTRPRIVLIDTFFIAEPEILTDREHFAYEQLHAMKAWDVKMKCITDLFSKSEYFDASFPVINNHNGWKDPELIHKNRLYQYGGASLEKNRHLNGFTPRLSSMDYYTFRVAEQMVYKPLNEVPEASWNYVQEMIDLCHDSGAEPIFVQYPLPEAYTRKVGFSQRSDEVREEIIRRGATYIDFSQSEIIETLGLKPQDFMKETSTIGNYHLNISGANKLTAFMAEELKDYLQGALSSEFSEEMTRPWQLMRFLKGIRSDDLVLLTVNDDASIGWLPEEVAQLKRLGLNDLPQGFWGQSYAALFTGNRKVLIEARSLDSIDLNYSRGDKLNGVTLPVDIHLVSTGVGAGAPEAHIWVDGYDYSFDYRGLNFAIYNMKTGRIRQVEQFDLYGRSLYLDLLINP